MNPTTFKLLLPLWLAVMPTLAADPATNNTPAAVTTTAVSASTDTAAALQTAPIHFTTPPKLEPPTGTATAPAKKHWWNRITTLIKSRPTEPAYIIQYQGMSSRPWAAIATEPSGANWQDLRVHHPAFGLGVSY